MTEAVRGAISDYLRTAVEGWNRFWFSPTDPAVLSLVRICAGAMLLYTHLVWSFDLVAFFGPEGWIPASTVDAAMLEAEEQGGSLRGAFWSHLWYIESIPVLWGAHLAALAVFACLMVGYRSRLMSVLAYLLAVAYVHRVPAAFFGLDKINCMLAMYLMIGPCGAYYSVDRWLAKRRSAKPLPAPEPSIAANVAIRLIQLHMCIIYLFSGLDKLQGTSWWDGTAVWLAMANLEYQSFDMTWLAGWPNVVAFLTHATIFWEVFYIAMVWNRSLRPVVLLMAVAVHGGIALCMGMITFGVVMIIGNLAFLTPTFVHALVDPVALRVNAALEAQPAAA